MAVRNTVTVNVFGPSPVFVANAGFNSGAAMFLGYTRNGSQITYQQFYEDVPGDQNGGDAGPPVDIQILGQIANVRLVLTKYNPTVVEALQALGLTYTNSGAAPGNFGSNVANVPQAGTLAFTAGAYWACQIYSPGTVIPGTGLVGSGISSNNTGIPAYNFGTCIIREPYEMNVGTKFTELSLAFTAYNATAAGVSSATLFTNTTSLD